MRVRGYPILGLFLILLCCLPVVAADSAPALPPNSMVMTATKTLVWDDGKTNIVELQGAVKIELDHVRMSADNAVVWMTADADGAGQSVEIALIGKAELKQQGVLRLDRELMIKPIHVTGAIRLMGVPVPDRDITSDLFIQATHLREKREAAHEPTSAPATEPTSEPTTGPATSPTTNPTTFPTTAASQPAAPTLGDLTPIPDLQTPNPPGQEPTTRTLQPRGPTVRPATAAKPAPVPARMVFQAGSYQSATTADGKLAQICTDGVSFRYFDAQQNLIEFVAHDMVLFTNVTQTREMNEAGKTAFQDHIVSAYFEGDVQVYMTPVSASKNELRMRAERVYYEFATDRAIMTEVVFHTFDVKKNIPVFMRADRLRQMSLGEFKIDGVEMSSSAFDTPTYGLYAGHAYVRADDTGDPRLGERITYQADSVILNAFGLPLFYFPEMGGTMTARGSAFRNVQVVADSNQYGNGIRTQWGLFETLGILPSKDVDTTFDVDYLSKRGVAGGLDGKYVTGTVDDTTKQPLADQGDFHSYFVNDHGQDVLGALRPNETPPSEFRGRAYWENQTFITRDLQLQVRAGYLSDSNFMAQWFPDEYMNGLPVDESIYLDYQKDSQVLTGLLEAQPNRAISTADEEQQNSEISRLPELGFYSVGDSVLADHLTVFSENSASALKFVRNTQTLAQQGFGPGVEPGTPSYEYTGDPGRTTFRGDSRQELDWPINAGPVKVVPYVFGRYTGYSQGVAPPLRQPQLKSLPGKVQVTSDQNRLMVGAGARITTDFWRVDDSVESDLFDLHRLRHVVSPELNLFTSAQSIDQDRLFIYDQQVDAINDISAVQLALRQRWQTKRGGPGRWRSVDVFTLNLYGNFFANQPANRFRDPTDFRGYFDYTHPEASLARNSANADAQWRISDSTTLLSDVSQNLDQVKLATASIGLAVQRDTRMTYFLGMRYIADLNSNIATAQINYALDRKYSVTATESLDLAQANNVFYTLQLTRNFDTFSANIHIYYDQASNNKGFGFGFQPFGVTRTVGSEALAPQQ